MFEKIVADTLVSYLGDYVEGRNRCIIPLLNNLGLDRDHLSIGLWKGIIRVCDNFVRRCDSSKAAIEGKSP